MLKRRQLLKIGGLALAGVFFGQGCQEKATNPEFPVSVAKAACIGCGACVAICPSQAITLIASDGQGNNASTAQIDQNLCTKCLTCLSECAYDAILFNGF